MLVSIIIPIYNVAPYVEKCLRSVMAQTYRKLEVIIVDDCGTDNSMEIVKSVIEENGKKDIAFRILRHKKNKGPGAARNTGIKAAKGEYVFFLDSDDIIMHLCIEVLVKCAEKYPGVDMVQGGYYSNVPQFIRWTRSSHLFPEGVEYIDNANACRRLLQQKNHLPMVHNRLIRLLFITENNLYNEDKIAGDDNLWTFLAGRRIKDMAFCNIPIYGYIYRPGSIVTSNNIDAITHGTAIMCDIIISSLPIGKWTFTELSFVLWRLDKAKSMGCPDPLLRMKWYNRMICHAALFIRSIRSLIKP